MPLSTPSKSQPTSTEPLREEGSGRSSRTPPPEGQTPPPEDLAKLLEIPAVARRLLTYARNTDLETDLMTWQALAKTKENLKQIRNEQQAAIETARQTLVALDDADLTIEETYRHIRKNVEQHGWKRAKAYAKADPSIYRALPLVLKQYLSDFSISNPTSPPSTIRKPKISTYRARRSQGLASLISSPPSQQIGRPNIICFTCNGPNHYSWDCGKYVCGVCNVRAPGHSTKNCPTSDIPDLIEDEDYWGLVAEGSGGLD